MCDAEHKTEFKHLFLLRLLLASTIKCSAIIAALCFDCGSCAPKIKLPANVRMITPRCFYVGAAVNIDAV